MPRIALYEFQTSIAMMYDRDEDKQTLNLLQDETLFPHHWKTLYLDTPCIKRHIATREAEFHQLPAIRQEIAQLQSQLDALNSSQ